MLCYQCRSTEKTSHLAAASAPACRKEARTCTFIGSHRLIRVSLPVLQLTEVAEHPVPPYAWPGNTATAAGGSARAAAQRDVEMGRSAAAKASAAAAPGSSNPFAGGLPAADFAPPPAARRQPGSGKVLERPPLGAISGQLDRSEAAGTSPAAAAFGRRSILPDDEDAMSPIWDAQVKHMQGS